MELVRLENSFSVRLPPFIEEGQKAKTKRNGALMKNVTKNGGKLGRHGQ